MSKVLLGLSGTLFVIAGLVLITDLAEAGSSETSSLKSSSLVLASMAVTQDEAGATEEATPESEVTPAEEGGEEAGGEQDEATPEAASLADVDTLWTCLAAFLVFFMQAGFTLVECGFTRAKNAVNIIMKNVVDLSLGVITFWMVGFGIMFGATSTGLFGTSDFFFDAGDDGFGWAFLIFQSVFCATAATIVSGAVAERTKFVGYLCYTVAITVIVYPVFGSWAWGGLWKGSGWLESYGFLDFAGSTVVHSIGGWAALAGAIVIGPRIGKYKDGKSVPIPGHSIPLAALGVFILWLGWFGFNPGSTTAVGGGSFAKIAVTTNLAAGGGAIAAMIASWSTFGKPDASFTLNGALAGLVAITAGCDGMSPMFALITGAIGGVVVVFSVVGLDRMRIDDPVGAVSVHGVCGAWGTLAVGLFNLDVGLIYGGGVAQLIKQAVGVGAGFAWGFGVSLVVFVVIKYTIGLRVSQTDETEGLDVSEHGMPAYAPSLIAEH